jgi:hypothetical protein
MVVLKPSHTYFYDPATHDFEMTTGVTDVGGSGYVDTLAPTATGMAMWTPNGLWELNAADKTWTALAVTGATLPDTSPDCQTMVFDSTRNRLLLTTSTGSNQGQVYAYDLPSHALTALGPAGATAMAAGTGGFMREAVYLPTADLVVLGAGFDNGDSVRRTVVYDVAANAWYAYAVDPLSLTSSFYDVSLGLAVDASERLWAINTSSRLFLLKLNRATATKLTL